MENLNVTYEPYELSEAEMQEIYRRAEAAVKRGDRLNLRSDGVFKSVFSKDTKESTYLRNFFISAVIGKTGGLLCLQIAAWKPGTRQSLYNDSQCSSDYDNQFSFARFCGFLS